MCPHRLVTDKRIASAADRAELKDLLVEMMDRFGLPPEPTKALFAITELKLQVQPYGTSKIEAGRKGGRIVFNEQPTIDHMKLIQLVQSRPKDFKLDQAAGALRFNMDMSEPGKRTVVNGVCSPKHPGATPLRLRPFVPYSSSSATFGVEAGGRLIGSAPGCSTRVLTGDSFEGVLALSARSQPFTPTRPS